MNERAIWIGGIAVGAAALVGGLAFAASKQSSSTTSTSIPPVFPPVTPPPVSAPPNAPTRSITLVDQQVLTDTPVTNEKLALHAPTGSTWTSSSVDQAQGVVSNLVTQNSGSLPITFTYVSGAVKILAAWVDASGTAGSGSIKFTP